MELGPIHIPKRVIVGVRNCSFVGPTAVLPVPNSGIAGLTKYRTGCRKFIRDKKLNGYCREN